MLTAEAARTLKTQLESLREEARLTAHKLRQKADDGRADDNDRHLLELELEKFYEVCEAIRRVDNDTHHICMACGDKVGDARRQNIPWAIRCRSCEDKHQAGLTSDRAAAERRKHRIAKMFAAIDADY